MRTVALTLLCLTLATILGCDNPPMNGRGEIYPSAQLSLGSAALQNSTRIEQLPPTRDQFGLLHVTFNIRSTVDWQQVVDAFVDFRRNGQVVDHQGPRTLNLKGNLVYALSFVSVAPADDYTVSLDYAK